MPKAKPEKVEVPEEEEEETEQTDKKAKKPREKKAKKDPNQPKKPCGAYIFFCNEKRPDVKKDHPDWGVAQIGKELGAQWKAATEESKKKHFAQAEKDKERYTKEMQAYQGKE